MSRRPNRWEAARDPWAARRRADAGPKLHKPATHGATWSFPVVRALKWLAVLVLVLVALDWLGLA